MSNCKSLFFTIFWLFMDQTINQLIKKITVAAPVSVHSLKLQHQLVRWLKRPFCLLVSNIFKEKKQIAILKSKWPDDYTFAILIQSYQPMMLIISRLLLICLFSDNVWYKSLLTTSMLKLQCSYLAASSSSSSLTNCLGMFNERTLSAICSSTRKWFPSVVGKRYIRDIVPPNTEDRNLIRLDQIVMDQIRLFI